jgi:hypothetical protein
LVPVTVTNKPGRSIQDNEVSAPATERTARWARTGSAAVPAGNGWSHAAVMATAGVPRAVAGPRSGDVVAVKRRGVGGGKASASSRCSSVKPSGRRPAAAARRPSSETPNPWTCASWPGAGLHETLASSRPATEDSSRAGWPATSTLRAPA